MLGTASFQRAAVPGGRAARVRHVEPWMAEQSPNNPPEHSEAPEHISEAASQPATPEVDAEQSLDAASRAAEKVKEAAGEALDLPEFGAAARQAAAANGAASRAAALGLL